jgi:large subunit ribosomal protein L24
MTKKISKFKKSDNVIVIAGKDKGKTGKIIQVLSKEERVIVSGINIAVVHKKPTANTPGQIVKVEKPIHISNISHIEDGKPVKIKFDGAGKDKVRLSRKTKKKIG